MFQLNKKTLIILLVVVIVIAGVAGAALYKPNKVTMKVAVGIEKERVVPPASGWLSSPGANPPGSTTITVNADTNGTEIVSVSVNISISDDDGQHSQTDEGSESDTISVKIGNETFEMTTDPGSGTATTTKDYPNGAQFGSNISVILTGVEFGGGKHPTGPIGIIPIPFLVYIDQGCAYTVEIKYTYMDYNSGQPGKDTKK